MFSKINWRILFKDSFITLLSYLSISLITVVFGNVFTYIKPIIFLGDNNLINSVLAVSAIISSFIVFFIQSYHKGYDLEIKRKFHKLEFFVSTAFACIMYVFLSLLFVSFYEGGSAPIIIKFLFMPGFFLYSIIDVFFKFETNIFECSILLLPIYITTRIWGVYRGRSEVLSDRAYLNRVAVQYRREEKIKNDSWRKNGQ